MRMTERTDGRLVAAPLSSSSDILVEDSDIAGSPLPQPLRGATIGFADIIPRARGRGWGGGSFCLSAWEAG